METEQRTILDSLCVAKRVDPSRSREDEYRTMFAPYRESISNPFFTPIISVYYREELHPLETGPVMWFKIATVCFCFETLINKDATKGYSELCP